MTKEQLNKLAEVLLTEKERWHAAIEERDRVSGFPGTSRLQMMLAECELSRCYGRLGGVVTALQAAFLPEEYSAIEACSESLRGVSNAWVL